MFEMSAMTHGMDPAAVQRLGTELQRRAEELRLHRAQIENLVYSVSWDGVDADRFRNEWWPEHATRLAAAADALHGFGQSALNNASEQLDASGGAGMSGGGGALPLGAPPGSGSLGDGLRGVSAVTGPGGSLLSTWDGARGVPWAGVGGDALSAYGYFTDLYTAGEALSEGRQVDAAIGTLLVGGDATADALKASGHPHGYGFGVVAQTWTEVGRAATDVDWSSEGLQQIADASLGDWGDALGYAATQMPTRLIKIFGL